MERANLRPHKVPQGLVLYINYHQTTGKGRMDGMTVSLGTLRQRLILDLFLVRFRLFVCDPCVAITHEFGLCVAPVCPLTDCYPCLLDAQVG